MNLATGKQAAVLSGGGAYASYEVGVLKALINGHSPATGFRPLAPDILTGASAGAINAAILASYQSPVQGVQILEATWNELTSGPGVCGNNVFRVRGNVFQWLDADCYLRDLRTSLGELLEDGAFLLTDFFKRGAEFLASSEPMGQRALELIDFASFISTDRVKTILERVVLPHVIRQSPTQLRVAATNWNSGRLVLFANHDFTDERGVLPVASSAAIPGIFPWQLLDGVPHVDGTLVENTPLLPSLRAGASTLYVVQHPDPADFPPDRVPSAVETFYRTLVIMINVLLERDIRRAGEYNQGLWALDQLARGQATEHPQWAAAAKVLARSLARSKDRAPYRPVVIHRFLPTRQFGGLLGLLDFDRQAITRMIQQGYQDACAHDCQASNCILPQRDEPNHLGHDEGPFSKD